MSMCAAQSGFSRLLKNQERKGSWERLERSGWIWEELEGKVGVEYDPSTMYEILKKLKYSIIVRNIV